MPASISKPRRFDRAVDGILLLDKPTGISSNAALQQARMLFRALKAGHAGSLDPLATGMLPICFGEATKVCNWLLDAPKCYRFTAKLGERTDTADSEGKVIETRAIPAFTEEDLNKCLQGMLGEQMQVPPMYSALKHDGERLYALARRGESVERAPRKICVTALHVVRFTSDEIEVVVECSKGTYVRTLAEDIAARLGTVAHLIALRRLTVAPFASASMLTLEQLTERFAAGGLQALDKELAPSDQALLHLPAVHCDGMARAALYQGKSVKLDAAVSIGESVRLYGPASSSKAAEFIGIGEVTATAQIQPRRLWNPPKELIPPDTGNKSAI